ncbi:MAG: DUF72 domain-containing protein [Polyangiaceae bacterium]|nr:DUF72 domain-containing protein [Polyangiaceae bacterium]
MDFGRIPSVDDVSFVLPPLEDRSRAVLAEAARAPASTTDEWLRAGAPAWARKDWLGRFYPKATRDAAFLNVYASKVHAIELNATYYRVPDEPTIAAWIRDTPPSFHFCPKFHKTISHRKMLAQAIPEAVRFAQTLALLGPRLGPAFLQLPPWADMETLPQLDAFCLRCPATLISPLSFVTRRGLRAAR